MIFSAPPIWIGRLFLLVGISFLSLLLIASNGPTEGNRAKTKYRGISFVGGSPVDERHIEELTQFGIEWMSQTPFGWQRHYDSPNLHMVTSGRVYWGEQDVGLRETTRLGHEQGVRTLLKPHVWLMDRSDGKWVGSIRMNNEEDWATWFSGYEKFILHYAQLAAESDVDAFCVGTELSGTTHREEEWRTIIAKVREVYDGPLTYGANWSDEYDRIEFWDALDFIGVQAYFPLSDSAHTSIEELAAAWQPYKDEMLAVSEKFDKPISFTEVGFKSTIGTEIEPWQWRSRTGVDHDAQARCYEATFRVFWDEPWFAGMFWWKWFPHWNEASSGRDESFTPQGKLAVQVLGSWYQSGESGSRPPSTAD